MLEQVHKTRNMPTSIVIFGGTGDLAQTKLLPSLLDLYINKSLPDSFVIIGLSRKDFNDSEYQSFVKESIHNKGHDHNESIVNEFCSHVRYVAGSFDDIEAYQRVKKALSVFDNEINQCTNKLFYLAVPPQYYEVIFDNLDQSNSLALCDGLDSWSRLLVEKPFGRDLETAKALEKKLCSLFKDEQIYRIDHYLAKDAIENIISLRFANDIIADSWDKDRIESVQVKLLETKDVSNRGSFYDNIGTLRDVGQNHMLQIFALLTMSPVDIHNPQAVRKARAEALAVLVGQKLDSVIRGQYEGYTDTDGVGDNSETETYFKLDFVSESPLWKGVQFILEGGKALDQQVNEAIVTFRSDNMCSCSFSDGAHTHKNVLKIEFAPEQKISLSVWVKKPGFDFSLHKQELTLLKHEVEDIYSPEAYERVLFDCISGDQTRFVSGKEVEVAWSFITPILEQFKDLPLLKYAPGSTGPNKLVK